ncbi:MAG TPA: malto-oligosyltrehalose synthase, partial [Burkholderiaceae bacterium]
EMPAAWRLALRRFAAAPQLQRTRAALEGEGEGEGATQPVPSRADEYLLVQTMLGTLPVGGLAEDALADYRERIERYMLKAVREAKLRTSWLDPDPTYEEGLVAFIRSVLGRVRPNPLLGELQALADVLAWFGAFNGLAMAALKLTSPGVPDIYQGTELVDLSLVDPDNRRPVDYARRTRLLDELAALPAGEARPAALRALAASPHDGRLKLWVTWRLLQLRREQPALFRDGGYAALAPTGACADHVVAFARAQGAATAITLAGRLFAKLLGARTLAPVGDAWRDTRVVAAGLPEGTLLDDWVSGATLVVEDGEIALSRAFAALPVAVLVART